MGKWSFVFPVVLGLLVASAWGHSDVFLANVGGQVGVGGANELFEPGQNFDLTTKVFEGVMYANFPPFGAEYGRDEPGWFALASGSGSVPAGASALPANAAVNVDLPSFSLGGSSDMLFYWNGAGAVDFQPISSAQPGVGFSLDPDPLGMTAADASLHEHPVYALEKSGAGVPADGVYLISPTVSVPGLATSQSFYMLFLADALLVDEEAAEELEAALDNGDFIVHGKDFGFFEEAVEYVQRTAAVPEPGSLVLIGIGVLLAGTRNFRRSVR